MCRWALAEGAEVTTRGHRIDSAGLKGSGGTGVGVARRPRLLDLYSGAGGCAVGYHRAGFEVIGVDIEDHPDYPFEFHQADALDVLRTWDLSGFDAIHASPPCQAYSAMSNCRPGLAEEYPDLVEPTRDALEATGLPWVIENVEGSPVASGAALFGHSGVELCGRMFGLLLYRHRRFESNIRLTQPHHPRHDIPASKAGHWEPGTIISVSGNCSPISVARDAMGIDWMTREDLSEAVPPAYTYFVGSQIREVLV